MVQKVCAAAGSVLGLVALGLVIFSCVSLDFVNVKLPPVEACTENPIGRVGIFESVFDSSCTAGDPIANAAYGSIPLTETPTLQYWPLFPAQNNFGGLIGDAPEFTTCEAFYADAGPLQVYASSVVYGLVQQGLGESFSEQQTDLDLQAAGIFLGIPGGITSFVAGSYDLSAALAGSKLLAGGVDLVNGALDALVENAIGCAANGVPVSTVAYDCSSSPAGAADPWFTAAGPIPVTTVLDGGAPFDYAMASGLGGGVFTVTDQTKVFLGNLFTSVAGGATPDAATIGGAITFAATNPTDAASIGAYDAQVAAVVTTFAGLGATGALNPGGVPTGAFGGLSAIDDADLNENFTFTAVKATWAGLEAALGGVYNEDVTNANAVFQICDKTTEFACRTEGLGIVPNPPLNSTDRSDLCLVVRASGLVASLAPYTDGCTYTQLLKELPTIGPLLLTALAGDSGALGDATAEAGGALLTLLGNAVNICEELELPIGSSECALNGFSRPATIASNLYLDVAPAEQGLIPENWTAPLYTLCLGLGLQGGACGDGSVGSFTFRNFVDGALASLQFQLANTLPNATEFADLTASVESLQSAAGIVNGVCATANTSAACGAIITSAQVSPVIAEQVLSRLPIPNNTADRIEACKDDETDIEKFETAQSMVPAGAAIGGVGSILGFVAMATNKTPVAVVAGLLTVIGGAVLLGALLVVRSAPVYALVGGEEEDYELFYYGAVAQNAAIASMALSIVGGIVIIVSGFLNRDAGAAETKVSNTY